MEIKNINGMTAQEIADTLNEQGYTYYGTTARAWKGNTQSRIYFGRDYVTIHKDGTITNHKAGHARALTIGDPAIEAINALMIPAPVDPETERKETGKTYEIIEDNAGTLHMYVRDEEGILIFSSPVQADDIQNCITDVEDAAAWDEDMEMLCYLMEEKELESLEEAREAYYDNLTSYEYGWNLIADKAGIYASHMGGAGMQAFSLDAA